MQAEGIILVFKSVSPSRAAVCKCNGIIMAQQHNKHQVSEKINTKICYDEQLRGWVLKDTDITNLTINLQSSTIVKA